MRLKRGRRVCGAAPTSTFESDPDFDTDKNRPLAIPTRGRFHFYVHPYRLIERHDLIRHLGKRHIVADQEELIVPVLRHLFLTDIDRPEGVGQILAPGGIEVRGRLIEEGDPCADGLQHRQPQGDHRAHGLSTGELVVSPFAQFAINHVAQHDAVIVAPGKLLVDFGDDAVDAISALADLLAEAFRQVG